MIEIENYDNDDIPPFLTMAFIVSVNICQIENVSDHAKNQKVKRRKLS